MQIPTTAATAPSVLFITMHKAGSVIANRLIAGLLAQEGMPHVDFAGHAFRNGLLEEEYCPAHSHWFASPGYYFGAFRSTYVQRFDNLKNNRLLIQIRDPRDCIVSLYFSHRYSHAQPGEGELKTVLDALRGAAHGSDIDHYALSRAGEYRRRMEAIAAVMSNYPDHLLLRYEEMVEEFDRWLGRIGDYLRVEPSESTLGALRQLADFRVEAEDVYRHKRQVAPGDFRRKLQGATQRQLTELLGAAITTFGYPLE